MKITIIIILTTIISSCTNFDTNIETQISTLERENQLIRNLYVKGVDQINQKFGDSPKDFTPRMLHITQLAKECVKNRVKKIYQLEKNNRLTNSNFIRLKLIKREYKKDLIYLSITENNYLLIK